MNRIKALYRSRAIACPGRDVYYTRNRDQWLSKLTEPGIRTRAEFLYNELDHLRLLRRDSKNAMVREARRHHAFKILLRVPVLGPIRASQIIASVGSPFRFRTKRQFWTYCGLAGVTRSSDDYRFNDGRLERRSKSVATRGLNHNYNRRLKRVFKGRIVRREIVSWVCRRRNCITPRVSCGQRKKATALWPFLAMCATLGVGVESTDFSRANCEGRPSKDPTEAGTLNAFS